MLFVKIMLAFGALKYLFDTIDYGNSEDSARAYLSITIAIAFVTAMYVLDGVQ